VRNVSCRFHTTPSSQQSGFPGAEDVPGLANGRSGTLAGPGTPALHADHAEVIGRAENLMLIPTRDGFRPLKAWPDVEEAVWHLLIILITLSIPSLSTNRHNIHS